MVEEVPGSVVGAVLPVVVHPGGVEEVPPVVPPVAVPPVAVPPVVVPPVAVPPVAVPSVGVPAVEVGVVGGPVSEVVVSVEEAEVFVEGEALVTTVAPVSMYLGSGSIRSRHPRVGMSTSGIQGRIVRLHGGAA